MARSQNADGGDDLQIWRTAANIPNEKSRITEKGWFSNLAVWREAITPERKKSTVLRIVKQDLVLGRILWNEVRKIGIRFGT
jgi:hypothetical protein